MPKIHYDSRVNRALTHLLPLLFSAVAAGAGLAMTPTRACAAAATVTATPTGYDEGQTLLGQKRYPEAVEKLRPVTVAQPDFAPAWYALALAARRAGDCAEAIPAYRRYATLRPTEAEPYFGLGLCLRDTGERPAAAGAFRRFLELEHRPGQEKWIATAKSSLAALEAPPPAPGGGAAAYEEAQRLRDAGKIDAALKRFADAVALEPDLIAARAAWGELLLKIRREPDAVAVFRGAVERNPQYPLAWYELAFALRETGRFAEAVEAYRRYIPLRPNDPDPHYGLARALERLGRSDEALRSFTTYVAMENRPAEERWVASAKAEIAALERGRGTRPTAGSAPPAQQPATPRPPTPPPAAPMPAAPVSPAFTQPGPTQPPPVR
jgi:predicted Zn-dependent protease